MKKLLVAILLVMCASGAEAQLNFSRKFSVDSLRVLNNEHIRVLSRMKFNAGLYTDTIRVNAGTNILFGNTITPFTANGFSLGTSALPWSDGFFGDGAVLNFNAGNYTITHSAGSLAFSGFITPSSSYGTSVGTSFLPWDSLHNRYQFLPADGYIWGRAGVRVGFGTVAAPDEYAIVTVKDDYTFTTNNEFFGLSVSPEVQKTSAAYTNHTIGIIGRVYLGAENTQNFSNSQAIVGVEGSPWVLAGAQGQIEGMVSFFARMHNLSDVDTVVKTIGLYVENLNHGGTSHVGTQYGIFMDALSGAGANYAIYTQAGAVSLGDALTVRANGMNITGTSTLTGNLLFTADNTYDIGATNATRPNEIFTGGQIKSQLQASGGLAVERNTDNSGGGGFAAFKSRGSLASKTDVQSGDVLFQIRSAPYSNGSYRDQEADYVIEADSAGGGTTVPIRHRWFTMDNGIGAERIRLHSSGGLSLGNTTDPGSTNFSVTGTVNVGTAGGNISWGVYTPTRSAEANLDANVTMTEAQYMRVGNTVTVSGRFTADPTLTATATSFEITLPVASNIGAVEDAAGTAFCGTIAAQGAAVTGSVANNTAVITWVAGDITSQSWSYTLTYQII